MRLLPIGTLLCAMLFSAAAYGDDWPQWLGPHRDGSSPEKIAPWKELKSVWKKPVGEGNSSPIVAGGVVYLHTKVKDKDAEMVQAFDAKTGELKWEKSYEKEKFKPFFGEGPRSTPCVHEKRLFTLGNTGTLCCWNIADGELLWRHDTLKDFKEENLVFGVSASPIVVDGKVLVVLGKGKTCVVAYDLDGKFAWKAGNDPGSYASPIVIGQGPKKEVVFLTGANVLSLSPSGDVLWKFPFKDTLFESSTTPVKVDNTLIASSVTVGAVGLKLIDKDGKPDVEKLWKNPALTCYFSTPVPAGKEHVFMVTGVASINPSITLRCVDFKTGKETWKKPNVGKYHAALMKLVDGNLLMLTDAGDLIMLAPDVKEYKELARSKICGSTWAHPALANGLLFVRDDKNLICVGMNGQH